MNVDVEPGQLDATDIHTIVVAPVWIQRHRELHRQPPSPSIHRAIDHLTIALAVNGQAAQPNTRQLLTTAEVAQLVGCSKRQARRIAARIGTRHGHQWLVTTERLEQEYG